jgi:hypothetical protein
MQSQHYAYWRYALVGGQFVARHFMVSPDGMETERLVDNHDR